MNREELSERIQDAEMVLVGLGEEFDLLKAFRQNEKYQMAEKYLADTGNNSYIPVLQGYFRNIPPTDGKQVQLTEGLNTLANLLSKKNYFVVSVSMNEKIAEVPWKEGRLVMPCGSSKKMQCPNRCEEGLTENTLTEQKQLEESMAVFAQTGQWSNFPERCCPRCGEVLRVNNIYQECYDENGYLSDWKTYTKWLQGTLNRKLFILELGVGLQFPSVIRFPFEKIAFFNQKAFLCRVNEKLYQLTEELNGKGVSIAENAIEWIQNLC